MMIRYWRSLPAERRALLAQIFRYAVVGFIVTSGQAATYWVLARFADIHVQVANAIGYLVAVSSGYVLHGRVTFAGTEREEGAGAHAWRSVRFVLVSLLSLGLNALWVWLCVTVAGWPEWTPIPGMLFVTPAIVFLLNKKWVFR